MYVKIFRERRPWLQIDLGKSLQVCAVATQGNRMGGAWTSHFKLAYSADIINWTTHEDENGTQMPMMA